MDRSGLIEVRVRDCACPDTPHPDGDCVYLRPTLSMEGGVAAEYDLILTADIADEQRRVFAYLAKLTATFVRYGVADWNFMRHDAQGRLEPLPFDVETLVSDYALARLIGAKANELYSEAVLDPLLEAARAATPPTKPSRTGRTGSSTSRRKGSTRSPRRSSSPDSSDGPQLRIAR